MIYKCGRCGGIYREDDLEAHANNAHGVAVEAIDFSPRPEVGNQHQERTDNE